MTEQEALNFETELNKRGYKKYTEALFSTETYGYFKSFKDSNDETLYMIEYAFWDFGKYGEIGNTRFRISINIIPTCSGRADMSLSSYSDRPIRDIEEMAQSYYVNIIKTFNL